MIMIFFFFSSRRRHTRLQGDWSSDVCSSDLLGLAYAFVVAKEECLILMNRPSDRGAELIAAESRNGGWIEEIARVQGAVPDELVCVPVKLVCSSARNCIDHSAGGLPVFSGKVAGQNGELLHGVHAQITAQHAAGPAVGVIVDADAVEPVIVLRGPCTRDNTLRPKAAVASSAVSESHLCLDAGDSGLEAGEIRPTAAVQRQSHNRRRLHDCVQR